MSFEAVRVWAVTATYRRPKRLEALIASLASETPALAGIIAVDNGGDEETARVLARAAVPVRHVRPGRNLGCGGGVAEGFRVALDEAKATHCWQLDDDATVKPGTLAELLGALTLAGADAAVPLIVDEDERICWFPGPLSRGNWRAIGREVLKPPDFRARFGGEPLTWTWSPWTSLLVTLRAVAGVGLPRYDYWFQGEDIEYTLRLSARFRSVLAPMAVCVHHAERTAASRGRFLKKCAQLQNNAFTFTRLPHGRRALRHLPGNFLRFIREEGTQPGALRAAFAAFWRGAVRGRPAGVPGFNQFQREWETRHDTGNRIPETG